MWMVIHMAKTLAIAQAARERLESEGFLVKLAPVYRKLRDEENYFELMVPELEAVEARQVLMDHGLC